MYYTTYNALVVYVLHTATAEMTVKTFCLALQGVERTDAGYKFKQTNK